MLSACKKEDFTEPVSVNMEVKIAEGSSPHLAFKLGAMMIDQIAFDGQRDQGGDVHFTTEDGEEIGPILFPYNQVGYIKRFDIPQGIYSHMSWHIELEDLESDDEDTDTEESDQSSNDVQVSEGALLISGVYTKIDGTQLILYIIVDEDEQFLIKTEGGDGSNSMTLVTGTSYLAQLIFDPYYAMQTVSVQSLEEAEVAANASESFIEISANKNEALYENILFRLGRSAKVVIK